MKSTYHVFAVLITVAALASAQGNWQGQSQWQGPVVTVTEYGPVVTIHQTQVINPLTDVSNIPAFSTSLASTTPTSLTSTTSSSQVYYPPSSSSPVYVPPTTQIPATTPAPSGSGGGNGIGGGAQTFSIVNSYSVACL